MKIIILLSAGILILAIILIAWRFYNLADAQYIKDKKEVTIHLKAIKENGKKRLKLSDSNGNTAIDHLITEVSKGATITWTLSALSNIQKIERIYSTDPGKVIFKVDAERISDNLFKLNVPVNVDSKKQEKYNIIYIHQDGIQDTIDPYIRIED